MRSATSFAAAFAMVTGTAAGAMSMPTADDAPNMHAPIASTPEPHPTSSTVQPGAVTRRRARNDRIVVGWSPMPKVAPGSICRTITPAGASNGTHAGRTTRSSSTHTGSANCRHVSATASSTSTNRNGHGRGSNTSPSAASSPSDVHSSTKPLSPLRSSTATTPRPHSASLASSTSDSETVTTNWRISRADAFPTCSALPERRTTRHPYRCRSAGRDRS